jgi:hypothetical protein
MLQRLASPFVPLYVEACKTEQRTTDERPIQAVKQKLRSGVVALPYQLNLFSISRESLIVKRVKLALACEE